MGRGDRKAPLLRSCLPWLLRMLISLAWGSLIKQYWLAGELHGSACLRLPSTGITGYVTKPGFHMCSEDLIYVLILTRQACNQLSHLTTLSSLTFSEDELNEFGFSLKWQITFIIFSMRPLIGKLYIRHRIKNDTNVVTVLVKEWFSWLYIPCSLHIIINSISTYFLFFTLLVLARPLSRDESLYWQFPCLCKGLSCLASELLREEAGLAVGTGVAILYVPLHLHFAHTRL